MHRRMNVIGVMADELYDVNLAAARPAEGGVVVAQHPDRGPDPLALRKLGPHLEAAIEPTGLPGRDQARRSVLLMIGVDNHLQTRQNTRSWLDPMPRRSK